MNNQQNIDDILKLLKSSYGEEEKTEKGELPKKDGNDLKLSNKELQDKLKAQFFTSGSNESTEISEDSYTLDEDFLSENGDESASVTEPEDEEKAEEIVIAEETSTSVEESTSEEEVDDDGVPPFDLEEETEELVAKVIEEPAEEIVEEPVEEIAEEPLEEIVEEPAEEIIEEPVEEIAEEPAEEIVEEPAEEIIEEPAEEIIEEPAEEIVEELSEEEKLFDILGEEKDDDGIFAEDENGELVIVRAEESDKAKVEVRSELTHKRTPPLELYSRESGQLALFENDSDTEEAPAETRAEEMAESDESQMSMDFGDSDTDEAYKAPEASAESAELDDSLLSLMYELGDSGTACELVGEERLSMAVRDSGRDNDKARIDASEAFAFNGEEYETEEQKEGVFDAYLKEKKMLLLRLLGCGFFALILFFYDLSAALKIELDGIFSYIDYPAAFALMGVQLLVFSAAFAWRELFSGIKKAFSFRATRWSVLSITLLFTFIHSIAMAIISPDEFSLLFGGIAAIYLFFGLLSDYLELCREIKTFAVYSSDESKFTFYTEGGAGTSADKMYRGGVPHTKNIYSPMEISFPKGFFSAVNCAENKDLMANYAITPVIALSTVAFVVTAFLGNEADVALGAFMLVMMSISPISSFALHTLPIYKTSGRLYKRDCAVAGEAMAKKYAACDYIVFGDRHLFSAATARDNGIVIYDDRDTRRVIEYLAALYGEIGGPMNGVFGECREEHSVKLRRIARNGVEAVIDNAHSLILGDMEFNKRYGISYPSSDSVKDGEGILGFAINGRHSAKLWLKYKPEPLFEMLAQKLAENGISCVIETYDPVINSGFVSFCRGREKDPINVVHKNAVDFYRNNPNISRENTGLVVCSSRFKLVETVIWCKKLSGIFKRSSVWQLVISGISYLLILAAVVAGVIPTLNQYAALALQLLCFIPIIISMSKLPKKDYFTFGGKDDSNKKQETEKIR